MTALGTILSNADLSSGHLNDFDERVRDVMGTALVAGSNVTITPSDAGDTITISSTGGGGGSSFVDAIADTSTIDLTVSGTTLSAVIPTTAVIQSTRQGIGVAASATEALTLGTFAGIRTIVDDQGDNIEAFNGTTTNAPVGARWSLIQGLVATPITTQEPSLYVSRCQNVASPTYGLGNSQYYSAGTFVIRGGTSDTTMVTGVSAAAIQYSNSASRGDACGLWGYGHMVGSSPGFGLGGFFNGRTSHANGGAIGGEVTSQNYETTPTDSTYGSTNIGANRMVGITLWNAVANDATKLGGTGVLFYRNNTTNNGQFDVGIGITSANTPIRNSTIRDNGASLICLDIQGTHTTAAIKVADTAGQVNLGASAGWATRLISKAAADGDNALILQPFSASHTARLLAVHDATPTTQFSIYMSGVCSWQNDITLFRVAAGRLKVTDAFEIGGTAGAGFLDLTEQSAAATTPASTHLRYYASADTISGTSTVRPAVSILRAVDSTGCVRSLSATLGDGCPIVPAAVPANTFTAAPLVGQTPTANTWYLSAITIDQPRVLTGIRIALSTVGTSNLRVCLFDANGCVVAFSTLAGTGAASLLTKTGGAAAVDTWLSFPFTATKRVSQHGQYWIGIQSDASGTVSIFRAYSNAATEPRQVGAGSDTADTFASNPIPRLTTIPTAAGSGGPYAHLY